MKDYIHLQKGNPLLKFIINIPWEYSDIVPDYVMGKTTCALFLSVRYHQLNPDYIHDRLKLLGNAYNLRVLLVQVMNILFFFILYLLISVFTNWYEILLIIYFWNM